MKPKSRFLDSIKFSVIIPLFNKEKSISSTIESVLKQTYSNFELLIVNDGSSDQSLQAAQSFKDTRIKIFNKPNGGVSSARNLGIELSQNQYVVFLDADDLWLPFCLEEFSRLIIKFPDAGVFCTNYNMTGKNLKGSDRRYYVKDYYYTSAFFLAKWGIPIMITGCVSISRKLFEEVGYFNQNITHGEDIDMWERLSKKSIIAKSEKVTTIYRTEAENRASNMNEKLKLQTNRDQFKIHSRLSKSQKLYFGVGSAFELSSLLYKGNNFYALRNLIKYPGWVVRGILLIIQVRIFRLQFTTSFSERN